MCPAVATTMTTTTTTTTRWCPTPEQLMILEEMYRGGVRTPNATQIQQITAHLSLYGKIEGKNVFYWFQNHKARDRQKLRRRLTKQLMLQHQYQHHHHHHYTQQQQQQLSHRNMEHFHHHPQQHQPNTQLFHHFIDPPNSCSTDRTSTSAGFHHHVSHHNSATFLSQVQSSNSTSCCAQKPQQTLNYTWKMEQLAGEKEQEKPVIISSRSSYDNVGDDNWVMIADVGPESSNISWSTSTTTAATIRPPLKTLKLFPTTATGLKGDNHQDETTRSHVKMFPITTKSIDVTPPTPTIVIIN
ncbi:hypothetical protein Dimus_020488 [Dionaea muscipula]